jgi:outer membrane murein-binding lipoprotein Lpp
MENRPRPPIEDREFPEEKKGSMKLPSGMILYIVMAVIAVAAAFGINRFFGVSKTGLANDVAKMDATIEAMKSDLRASKDSITTALNGLTTQIDTKVNSSVSSINTKINTIEGSVKTANDQANTATSQANQSINKITVLEKQLSDLQTAIKSANELSSSVASLSTSLNALKTQYSDLKAQYDALKIKVDGMAIPTTTTTPPPTTTPTTTPINTVNVVIATVSPATIALSPAEFKNAFNVTIINNKVQGISGGTISFSLLFTGLSTSETLDSVLTGTPLSDSSGSITWRTPTINNITKMATYTGDFNGYIGGGSSTTITVIVDITSSATGNVFMSITNPTISGFTVISF